MEKKYTQENLDAAINDGIAHERNRIIGIAAVALGDALSGDLTAHKAGEAQALLNLIKKIHGVPSK